jgi:hypothetical protein
MQLAWGAMPVPSSGYFVYPPLYQALAMHVATTRIGLSNSNVAGGHKITQFREVALTERKKKELR